MTNVARGGLSERHYVGDIYRKVERLWFEVREANLGYNIVDIVDELFSLASMEEETELERDAAYDEKEKLEADVATLESQVETLELERDGLQDKLDLANETIEDLLRPKKAKP